MRDKSSLRRELLQKRDNIPPEVRRAKNRLIQARFEALDEIKNCRTIFFFASFRSEVDTFPLISNALLSGKRVILPKVDITNKMLQLFEIKSSQDLTPGYMGIPEPGPLFGKVGSTLKEVGSTLRREDPTRDPIRGGEGGFAEGMLFDINDVDVVIIPGACYDDRGNRVGYGGGYYDRLLAGLQKKVPIIAPAYEEQIVETIPSEPHDIRVTAIVTDRRVILCGPSMGTL